MKLLPVALKVEGARVLVVGGGAVATRKVLSLLECGALVIVVSPTLSDELTMMASAFMYSARSFEASDCDNCKLVFACTSDSGVNAEVAEVARTKGVWCHVADDASASTLHGAATVRRDEICIGITTGGGSPALAKHLKAEVENCVGEEYSQLLNWMSAGRNEIKSGGQSQKERSKVWRQILQSDALALLRAGKCDDAHQLVKKLLGTKS